MSKSSQNIQEILPLREPTYFILLSLATESKHGYAILKDVEDLSQGKVRLSTSTLYEAIARLLDQQLIERVPDDDRPPRTGRGAEAHPGKPRKAYRITKTGLRVLEAEMDRMGDLISVARRWLGEENI
jgi:PadR family transcriptional regulator, regulatory protein PadR